MREISRKICLVLGVLCIAGCASSEQPEQSSSPNEKASAETTEQAGEQTEVPVSQTAEPVEEQYSFCLDQTEVSVNDDLDTVLGLLGDSNKQTSVTSEAYLGTITTYYYDGIELVTYPGDTKDYIKRISFTNGTYQTDEGVKVGDGKSELENAYGDALTKVSEYIYSVTLSNTEIQFILINDQIASIDYYNIVNGIDLSSDQQEPEIVNPFEVTVYTDQSEEDINFTRYTTASDEVDGSARVVVDHSALDLTTCGDYDVVLYAFDEAGNMSSATTTYTVAEKPSNYKEPDSVEELADSVLDEIITEDMSTTDKCTAIYKWIRSNFSYSNTSDKTDWVQAASTGFRKKTGDCFVYYSVAQELLYRAGIQSMRVEKNPGHESKHYWSLVYVPDQGWYHFDTTPRKAGGEFDLVTDDYILDYSSKHDDSHDFNTDNYPSTPTEEVQK